MPELIRRAKYETNRGCYLLTPGVKEALTLVLSNVASVDFHLLLSPLAKRRSSETFAAVSVSELFPT